MKKFRTKLFAVVVASSMIVTPVMAAPSVDELQSNKAAKESEVSSLQQQLTSLMTKVNKLEENLISKGEEITQAEKDLKKAEEKEAEQYEAMKKRIKFMYEGGDTSALEALVTSSDFSDLVNKAEYVQNIHTYDRTQLVEYVETKQKVADIKSTLETEMTDLQNMEAEYTAQQEELNATLTSKEAEVADLDSQIQEAAQAALAARQAEEAAAAEAAAARNNNNNNSNRGNGGGSGSTSGGSSKPSGGGSAPSYNPSTGNAIVDRAYSKMGLPYAWGAVGPNSFDCSGLVSYALTGSYTRLGTTYTFLGWNRVSDPQPGDIAVNTNHCGIYIGGGKMIHAPHTGAVVTVGPVQSSMVYVRY